MRFEDLHFGGSYTDRKDELLLGLTDFHTEGVVSRMMDRFRIECARGKVLGLPVAVHTEGMPMGCVAVHGYGLEDAIGSEYVIWIPQVRITEGSNVDCVIGDICGTRCIDCWDMDGVATGMRRLMSCTTFLCDSEFVYAGGGKEWYFADIFYAKRPSSVLVVGIWDSKVEFIFELCVYGEHKARLYADLMLKVMVSGTNIVLVLEGTTDIDTISGRRMARYSEIGSVLMDSVSYRIVNSAGFRISTDFGGDSLGGWDGLGSLSCNSIIADGF